MDYKAGIERLEHLRSLVDAYVPIMYESTAESRQLHVEICEVYGEVSGLFDEVLSPQRVSVPTRPRTKSASEYPNYFEAGFMSGRSIHTHQGRTELLKVIGKVKALAARPRASTGVTNGSRVFLVHGHDDALLQTCARFIEKIGLPVTILREQPSQGRTLIEKFEDYSDAAFAIVMLTGDDLGGPRSTPCDKQNARARQNVLLELGFFLGKLGRERVCALYEDGVELPSDYDGVVYVAVDQKQAWKTELARELKAAGLRFDMNASL